jgi:predicted Zn-dependent peptidase
MQIHELRVLRSTLSNGLVVLCVPQPALHVAAVALHVRVGSRFETPANNGVSHMLEHMLYRGTPTYPDAHAQALAFERLGGTLYAATQADRGIMALGLPPENLRPAFDVFAEVITSPAFTGLEAERGIIREEILAALDERDREVDPDNLSRALMFPEHPLGMTITGSLASMGELDVPMLRAHHQRHYTGQNAVLCFAGAIDADACLLAATERLRTLPAGQVVPTTPPAAQTEPRVQVVNNQGSQADLRLAFRAPGERDPDASATELLVRLLDDGMSTRLYAQICDARGLCYDVSADYEAYTDDGVVDLAAAVQHTRTPVVFRELCAIVRELALQGPSAEELRICKDRHRWEIRALLDDAEGLADFHGVATLTGTVDSLIERERELEAVTRDQLIHVARKVFRPEGLCAVAVGSLGRRERRELEALARDFQAVTQAP